MPHASVIDRLTAAQLAAYNVVVAKPGCRQNEAALALRVTHQTMSHHLRALVRLGAIVQLRDGRALRHFPGPTTPGPETMLEALLADPAKAPLLVLLASNPGPTMTINQMARRTGASFGSVKGTLRQLGAIGLLTLERRHYRYLVQPTQRLRDTVARHVATDQAPSPSRVGG